MYFVQYTGNEYRHWITNGVLIWYFYATDNFSKKMGRISSVDCFLLTVLKQLQFWSVICIIPHTHRKCCSSSQLNRVQHRLAAVCPPVARQCRDLRRQADRRYLAKQNAEVVQYNSVLDKLGSSFHVFSLSFPFHSSFPFLENAICPFDSAPCFLMCLRKPAARPFYVSSKRGGSTTCCRRRQSRLE